MLTNAQLLMRVRRAYEFARLRRALGVAVLVAGPACLAFLNCAAVLATAAAIGLLLFVVSYFTWRGQDHARGLNAGLVAGLSPFVLPILAQNLGHFCSSGLCLYMPAICLGAGVLGGLTLAVLGLRPRENAHDYLLAALSATLCCGAAGCLVAGLGGLAGMGLGVLSGSVPLLVARRA